MRKARPVKWGHLSQINYKTKVGSEAWYASHPSAKVRKLSAYRYLHLIAPGHAPVRTRARLLRRNPSSRLTTAEMLHTARLWRGY